MKINDATNIETKNNQNNTNNDITNQTNNNYTNQNININHTSNINNSKNNQQDQLNYHDTTDSNKVNNVKDECQVKLEVTNSQQNDSNYKNDTNVTNALYNDLNNNINSNNQNEMLDTNDNHNHNDNECLEFDLNDKMQDEDNNMQSDELHGSLSSIKPSTSNYKPNKLDRINTSKKQSTYSDEDKEEDDHYDPDEEFEDEYIPKSMKTSTNKRGRPSLHTYSSPHDTKKKPIHTNISPNIRDTHHNKSPHGNIIDRKECSPIKTENDPNNDIMSNT